MISPLTLLQSRKTGRATPILASSNQTSTGTVRVGVAFMRRSPTQRVPRCPPAPRPAARALHCPGGPGPASDLSATTPTRRDGGAPALENACDFQRSFMTWDHAPRPDPPPVRPAQHPPRQQGADPAGGPHRGDRRGVRPERAVRPHRPLPHRVGVRRRAPLPGPQPGVPQHLLRHRAAQHGAGDHLPGRADARGAPGRGLPVPGHRRAAVRPDAGPGDARGRLRGHRGQRARWSGGRSSPTRGGASATSWSTPSRR